MFPPKMPEWPVDIAYDELPAWMRRTRRAMDWPLALAGVLALALIAPLLLRAGLPPSDGLRSEAARALEMSESIQAGILYPRWAADFNLGYGSPVWSHLPPLPHYLAGLHRVLAQTSAEYSVKFTLIGAQIVLGLALFGFARRRWGAYAGVLAAALGLFSPQVALVKPLLQADLGALWAGGLFLASLWALDRLRDSGRGTDLLLAAGSCMALWLAHQPLNLIFGALILAWLLLQRAAPAEERAHHRLALTAYALGFLASAFYWLPAWAERGAVRWLPVADAPLTGFGSPSPADIFGWNAPLNRAAINSTPAAALGIALWGAAALALLMAVAPRLIRSAHGAERSDPAARETGLFALAGALLLIGALPPLGTRWSVEWPPFGPRDLVFPAALCGALAGASLGHRLQRRRSARVRVAGILALTAAIAGGGLLPPSLPAWSGAMPPLTPASLVQSEAAGAPLVAREAGWLLPRAAPGPPAAEPSLLVSYESDTVDKIVRDHLPATTLVDVIEHTPQSARILVRSAGGAEITLRTFMAEGWRAHLDGRPVTLRATEPDGLIALSVPEGRHELQLSYSATGARRAGWALTAAAFALGLRLAARRERAGTRHVSAERE